MSTLQIKNSTKKRLVKLGDLSSTFDSVLNNLLDHAEKCGNFRSEQNC